MPCECSRKELELTWFRERHLTLVWQIVSEGKTIGYVYLRADLREINQRFNRYALIAFGVLVISLVAAILVSSRFRKSVAKPIVGLAETAQTSNSGQRLQHPDAADAAERRARRSG
jgi:sensor histidine kinase regulating citrate/malate metabolism